MTIESELKALLKLSTDAAIAAPALEIARKYDKKIASLSSAVSRFQRKNGESNCDELINSVCSTVYQHMYYSKKNVYVFYLKESKTFRCASRKQKTIDELLVSDKAELIGVYSPPMNKKLVDEDLRAHL